MKGITSIGHVAIRVKEFECSLAFRIGTLGFSVDRLFDRLAAVPASLVEGRSGPARQAAADVPRSRGAGGAEFAGSGNVHNTSAYLPNHPRDISGLVLHALASNTLLGGRPIKTLGRTLVV